LHRFRAKWGGIKKRREQHGRAQVGEAAERLAEFEEAFFRAEVDGVVVEGGAAYRAEENGVGGHAGLESVVRQRVFAGGQAGAADWLGCDFDFMAEDLGNGVEDVESFGGNFGADAVARKSRDS
jgi:hypothetical protein